MALKKSRQYLKFTQLGTHIYLYEGNGEKAENLK